MHKITWKSIFKELRQLFFVWEYVLILILLFGSHLGYFYFLTNHLIYSVAISLMGTLFFFKVFIFPNRKLKKYQYHLSELLKYTTNVTFFLQTGNNVLYALKTAKGTVDRAIGKDIQKTIDILEKDAVLNTESFKKYDFPALDQYHRNLEIKYDRGGKTTELFNQIQKNMVFELGKRDELYKKRKGFAMNVYIILGMVASMLPVLRIVAPFLMDIFLSIPFVGLFIITLTYSLILIDLYFLQKHNLNISVRL